MIKFKTVKEFLESLIGTTTGHSEYGVAIFDVSPNSISIYLTSKDVNVVGEEVFEAEVSDVCYGTFRSDGGHFDLVCDDYWTLDFEITEEELQMTRYKMKLDLPQYEKVPKMIEL